MLLLQLLTKSLSQSATPPKSAPSLPSSCAGSQDDSGSIQWETLTALDTNCQAMSAVTQKRQNLSQKILLSRSDKILIVEIHRRCRLIRCSRRSNSHLLLTFGRSFLQIMPCSHLCLCYLNPAPFLNCFPQSQLICHRLSVERFLHHLFSLCFVAHFCNECSACI